MDIYYINGEFVVAEKSSISVHSLSVLRGYGVFDFLRTYNSKPFHLKKHIERLKNSAEILEIPFIWSIDEISDLVHKILSKNNHPEFNIRIIITGGSSTDFIIPDQKPSLLIIVTKLHEISENWYNKGVRAIISKLDRYKSCSKSTNYTSAIISLNRTKKANAIESLYMNQNNHVLEGTTSNYFMIKKNRLITPDKEILSGITRKIGIKIQEK